MTIQSYLRWEGSVGKKEWGKKWKFGSERERGEGRGKREKGTEEGREKGKEGRGKRKRKREKREGIRGNIDLKSQN